MQSDCRFNRVYYQFCFPFYLIPLLFFFPNPMNMYAWPQFCTVTAQKMRKFQCSLTPLKFSDMSLISDVGHLMPRQQNRCYVIESKSVLLFIYLFIYSFPHLNTSRTTLYMLDSWAQIVGRLLCHTDTLSVIWFEGKNKGRRGHALDSSSHIIITDSM